MQSSAAVGLNGLGLYLLALGLMMSSTPAGVTRQAVAITDAEGRACLGTAWQPEGEPRAVMLLGHGVTSNRGVMAMLGKAFATNGYEAIAFDFLGHGRSRERFNWNATPGQVTAWVQWAESEYPGKPLAYLGHSMGGFAGNRGLTEMQSSIPFVSLGMLPGSEGRWPPGPILIALGRYEQLFNSEQANARAEQAPEGNASVLVSPWSDHALEPLDPVLVGGIINWVDEALGLPQGSVFPLGRWFLAVVSVPLGMLGNLMVALWITAQFRRPALDTAPRAADRAWSLNPYRLTARLLGGRGHGERLVAGGFLAAIPRGLLFGLTCVVTLSLLLTTDMFTSRLDHPERLRAWLIALPFVFAFFLLDAYALESVPHKTARRRFLVAALTRVVPILTISFVLQLPGVGMAFVGMMIGILGFLAFMMAIVHAVATRATNDYRAGAMACAVIFAWVVAFWIPLSG